jgi:hypothetical protein
MAPKIRNIFIGLILVLCCVSTAFALPSVSISQSDSGTYTVQGTGMDVVAGIQLDINYDASLGTPKVTQGGGVSGAMFVANTNQLGNIKIAIISTHAFSASGQIAAISFASKTGSGGVTSANVSIINSAGATVAAAPVSIVNASGSAVPDPSAIAGLPFTQPTQTTQTTQTGKTGQTATATTPTYMGTVSLPTDQQQRADSQPPPSPAVPASSGEPAAAKIAEQTQPSTTPAADAKAEETPQFVVYKGIIDRFRQHSGSKKLPVMAALFDKKITPSIQQEPMILLSDGKSKATLTVDIPARINSSPNFAVNGGTLISFKLDKQNKGRWVVEVLPEAGSIKVTVTIIAGAEEFEYPLTVAPPVESALTLDENGWNRFLKEIGTTTAPQHDLNNDGVRDFMDEYIFVANHLAKKSPPAKQAVPPSKSAQ